MSEFEKAKIIEKKVLKKTQKPIKKKELRKSKYPVIPKEKLEDMYLNKKMSMNQIRDAVGVKSENSLFVRNQLIKYGIQIRTQKQGLKLVKTQQKKETQKKPV